MTNWKLPDHLEPYREFITFPCKEAERNKASVWYMREKGEAKNEIDLLQRLYEAGKLK